MRNFRGMAAGAVTAWALAAVGTCFGANGGGIEKYCPKDTEVIVHLNVRQLLDSELVKNNKQAMEALKSLIKDKTEADPQAQKYLKALGFDVLRDLNDVTIVMTGSADPAKGLMIFRGKFDREKFHATAEEASKEHPDVLKLSKSGKFQLVEIIPPGQDKSLFVTLAGTDTALAAHSKETLTAALERESATKAPAFSQVVQNLMAKEKAKESLTFLATSSALAKIAQDQAQQHPEAAMITPLLQTLQGFNGFVDVRKDVNFQVGIVAKDADEAKQLSQQISLGLGVAGGMIAKKAKEEPKLAPAVDVVRSIRTNSQGNTVTIRGQIPAAAIEQALKNQ